MCVVKALLLLQSDKLIHPLCAKLKPKVKKTLWRKKPTLF